MHQRPSRREDKYVETRHIDPMELPADVELSADPYVADMQRRHYTLKFIEQQLEESGAWRPCYSIANLTPDEQVLSGLLSRLSYFEKLCTADPGQYHGVALGVRTFAAYMGWWNWGGVGRAADVFNSLIDKNGAVVLEEASGTRPRVLMPNPQQLDNPTLPQCTYQEQSVPEEPPADQNVHSGHQCRDSDVEEEIVPPPPAQEGQGGASAQKAPMPPEGIALLASLSKTVGTIPDSNRKSLKSEECAFEAKKLEVSSRPEVMAAQRLLEERRAAARSVR